MICREVVILAEAPCISSGFGLPNWRRGLKTHPTDMEDGLLEKSRPFCFGKETSATCACCRLAGNDPISAIIQLWEIVRPFHNRATYICNEQHLAISKVGPSALLSTLDSILRRSRRDSRIQWQSLCFLLCIIFFPECTGWLTQHPAIVRSQHTTTVAIARDRLSFAPVDRTCSKMRSLAWVSSLSLEGSVWHHSHACKSAAF